ncbi:MAG: PAS domain S-box protein [Pseudomonadota bacterium]
MTQAETRLSDALQENQELRAALSACKAREQRLLEVIDHMPASVFVRDADGRFVLINRTYEQRYGVRRKDVLGKTVHEVFPADRAEDFATHDRRVLARGAPVEEEVTLTQGAETEVHASLKFPLFDSPNRVANIGGIEYDVTARVRAQADAARILSAIEACSDGLAFWDAGNRFIMGNQRYHSTIRPGLPPLQPGTSFEDLLRDCLERGVFTLPEGCTIDDWIAERLRRRSQFGDPFEQRLSGRWYQVADRRSPDGGTLVLMTDITELKRREAALSASEEKFRRLVEGLHEQVFFTSVSLAGTFEYVSPSVTNVLGYEVEEVQGLWHKFAADEATIQKVAEIEKETLKGKTPKPYEVRVQHKDGSTRVLEIVETPAFDEAGNVVTFEGIYRDITERKKAEEVLRDNEARLNAILESSPIGVTVVRGDGRFLFVNTRMTDLVGMTREQLLATPAREIYIDPKQRDGISQELRRVGYLRDREVQLRRTDGSTIVCLLSFVPADYFGEATFFGWVHDITDRKAAEAALRAAKDQAEQALADLKKAQQSLVQAEKMASLGQLTAGIAHEIKNPLNFVNNFSETSVELLDELKETIEGTEAVFTPSLRAEIDELIELLTTDLGKINQHGKRADGIVKSMLLHARGDLSERMEVDLNSLVEEALNLAYHGERARDKRFQVAFDTAYDEGAGSLEVVPQEVTRVLCNLFANAFYAVTMRGLDNDSRDYAPTIGVTTRSTDDRVEIAIRDNGIGMPKSVVEKLFTPFFTTKPTGEGTGLGLSMSYDIVVQQHSGTITVESELGNYTEFVIQLPRQANPPAGQGT